jgi:hypothetical protein
VNVGMMLQVLSPAVEHGQKADHRAQVLGVFGDAPESFRGGTK